MQLKNSSRTDLVTINYSDGNNIINIKLYYQMI